MHIARRLLLVVLTPLFTVLLFLTALDWGIVKTVGDPSSVKTIVAESGIYDSLVPALLDQSKQINSGIGSIPLTDPAISQAATTALSPTYVRQQSENIINGIYDWLEGKTAQPDFHVNLSTAKLSFADAAAGQAKTKVSSLPKCTTPYTATTFDIYHATCLPPGVTPAAVALTVKQAILNGQGFLDNTSIDAASVRSGTGQPVFSHQLKDAPRWYQWAKKSPIILIILTVLTAGLIFLLSPSHRKGLRRIGWSLVGVGALMLIFAWGLDYGAGQVLAPKINVSNSVMENKTHLLLTDLLQRVDKNYWIFGGTYAALGVVALVTPALARKRTARPAAEALAAPAEPPTPAAPEPGPPRRPPKIQ